jgi:transposase
MFKNWYQEILNSFIRFGDKRLHNGHIEGINNKIKVIKRVAFGYRNFSHFRNRILYIINQKYVLKK